MKVLVINCGSSSLKFQLMDSSTENVIAKGICERIGLDGILVYQPLENEKIKINIDMPNHKVAFQAVMDALTGKENGVINSLDEIDAIGHRIVHGGEKFSHATLLSDEVIKEIESCSELAPLHNPANLIGITTCKEMMPNVPMVGVFDTAFHQTMPQEAFLYGIPYEYYEKYKVRRYGFHGTSHAYVSKRAAEILGKDILDSKIIVCHLGNGASITAVKNGESIDTSMGFTPLEGLIMGTRSGDIDPAITDYIAAKEGLTAHEVVTMLNQKSGILGLFKVSSDFRELEDASKIGDKQALLTLDTYAYRVAKYIGSYMIAMGGIDAVVFTAGVGENDTGVRELVCKYLDCIGAHIDLEKNNVRGKESIISTEDSTVTLMVVPTNEELAIARETVALIK